MVIAYLTLNFSKENKCMNKKLKKLKRKIYIISFFLICVIGIMFISIIKIMQTNKQLKTSIIPNSGLSNSVFEKQNNEYETPSEDCTQYYLLNGHYSYDMDFSPKADVGSSSFFDVSTQLKLGVTYTEETKVLNILATDLKDGFGIDNLQIVKQESGYRNGWESIYYVLNGTEENTNTPVKCIAYTGKLDEGTFIVSSFSKELTYEQLVTSCIKIYDSIHIPDEWKKFNETETTRLFETVEPETASTEP